MAIPESDQASRTAAEWLKRELENRDMTAMQLAEKMNAPLTLVEGLLAAVNPSNNDACVWHVGNAMRVASALGLPSNTVTNMIHEGKKRRNGDSHK